MNIQEINPALKELQLFTGDWLMELTNASFLSDQSEIIRGEASFEWIEDGDFLIMRQGTKKKGNSWASWLISRDESNHHYTVLYIDDRRKSRVYEMSFEKDLWQIWRTTTLFKQRFEGKISENKMRISGHWEKSFDDKNWEHDFDISYIRK